MSQNRLNVNTAGMSKQILHSNPSKRAKTFEKLVGEYRKNENDQRIPEYRDNEDSKAYLITLKGLSGMIPPPLVKKTEDWLRFSAQFHLTFFYENTTNEQRFFFGRSSKSSRIRLEEKNGSFQFSGSENEDNLFFHTCLNKKDLQDKIYLVLECVIIAEREVLGSPEARHLSGGFAKMKLFPAQKESQEIDLIQGTPRALLTQSYMKDEWKGARCQIRVMDYPKLNCLSSLVPQNNIVCQTSDIIPGLQSPNEIPERFPLPNRDKNIDKLEVNKQIKKALYIHNLEIQAGDGKLEKEIEQIIAKLHAEKMRKLTGQIEEDRDIRVKIMERRVNCRCHNGWTFVTGKKSTLLNEPNKSGLYSSDGMITIKDYIPHDLVALVFELEFKANIQSTDRDVQICMGFNIYMPDFDVQYGTPTEQYVTFKMRKGPNETFENNLIISEQSSTTTKNIFEFALKAFISADSSNPDDKAIRRGKENIKQIGEQYSNRSSFSGMTPSPQKGGDQYLDTYKRPDKKGQQSQFAPAYDKPGAYRPDRVSTGDTRADEKLATINKLMKEMNNDQEQFMSKLQNQAVTSFNKQSRDDFSDDRAYQQAQQSIQNLSNSQSNQSGKAKMEMYQSFIDDIVKQTGGQQFVQSQDGPKGKMPVGASQASNEEQLKQITNVFYHMLNTLADKHKNEHFSQLATEMRESVTTRPIEDLFGANVPYLGDRQINLLKVKDMSEADQARLTQGGYGDVFKGPSNNILSEINNIDLLTEKRDQLTKNTISFQFVGYRTPRIANVDKIPKKFYMVMRFFTFCEVVTDYQTIELGEDRTQDGQAILQGKKIYFLKKERRGVVDQHNKSENMVTVTFNVDPEKSKIADENFKLAKYLKDRYLTIDIFDGDSKFFFGSCKLPLYQLCRQGASGVVKPKECEIFNPDGEADGRENGFLQVVMSNQGGFSAKVNEPQSKSGRQPTQMDKSKRIVSNPMSYNEVQAQKSLYGQDFSQYDDDNNQKRFGHDYGKSIITQLNHQQLQASAQDQDLRKKLRIDRIKKRTNKQTMNTTTLIQDSKQPDWVKAQSLREIDMIRQAKKSQVISEAMGVHSKQHTLVNVVPGQITFEKIIIENKTRENQNYNVTIRDPDSNMTEEDEVQMVYDQREFEHWVKQGQIAPPKNYKYVADKDLVLLPPGEKIELLFKFLTYRDVSYDTQVDASAKLIKERNISITISTSSGMEVFQQHECTIKPQFPCVDHTFRHFEPENSFFKITIPPFLQYGADNNFVVEVSNPIAHARLNQTTNAIDLQSKTDHALSIFVSNVYVYSDKYHTELLATCRVEVTPLQCMYVKTNAGIDNPLTLSLPAFTAQKVSVYADDNSILKIPEDNRFDLSSPHIPVTLQTFTSEQRKVIINAIDYSTKKLVYSWMIFVASQMPHITRTERIKYGKDDSIRFKNNSKKKWECTFDLSSDRPEKMRPKMSSIKLRGKEDTDIYLDIAPEKSHGKVTYHLFIQCTELVMHEVIAVEIEYPNPGK